MTALSRPIAPQDLGFAPPEVAAPELAPAVERLFGLRGALEPLEGERDRNHRLTAPDGARYVVKVSGRDEDPALVDFQTRALLHLAEVAPDLPVPRVVPTLEGAPSALLPTPEGAALPLRVLTFLPGLPMQERPPRSRAALQAIGGLQARLCRALRGFFHPAARHFMPWDLTNGLVLQPELRRRLPAPAAALAAPALERLEALLPRLAGLRAQVIHHDGHLGNLLCDPAGGEAVTGVIDFGDMIHGPLVLELAVSLASLAEVCDDLGAAAEAVVAAFHGVVPLEAEELELLPDLTLGRLILTVELTALKAEATGAPPALRERHLPAAVAALGRAAALDPEALAGRLRAACGLPVRAGGRPAEGTDELIARRRKALGPTAIHFYDRPLHIVRGRDVWLYDAEGREYLDCYNNVPSVGHCHPRVVEALARQAATLNTHTRYLHEGLVEYAERLTATLPGELSVCLFACTGSEANDLALRIARVVTGAEGAVVTENAYHGTTLAVTQLSTIEYPASERPGWLEAVAPPDLYRGPVGPEHPDPGAAYGELVEAAIERLRRRGVAPALFMVDTIFDAPGIHTAPPGYLEKAQAAIRAAGGLVVADEVQAGLCRLGDHVWGFQDSGVVPDIVTLGKPMGDGHPLAALVTTPEIARRFASRFSYFNTFAGNPVSAAVGLAVLEVVERERLLDNAGATGRVLGTGLRGLAARHAAVGDVRGKGLFWGVELVRERAGRTPAPELAARVAELLRADGVLMAASGPHRNVLKIRPPLTFRPQHAERALEALERALDAAGG